ncbi:MAG: hypothetical protein ACXW0F_10740 [Gaiellaceae bacterium]
MPAETAMNRTALRPSPMFRRDMNATAEPTKGPEPIELQTERMEDERREEERHERRRDLNTDL